MRLREYLAFHLIGTSLEQPARRLRASREFLGRLRQPEWNSVRDEGAHIEEFYRQAICSGMNCIDVGSHLGAVLDRMQKYAPDGHHIGFELTPYKWRWLKSKFRGTELRQEALSDQDGTAEFHYQVGHSGFSGLRSHRAAGWRTETFRVRCARLDDIVPLERNIGLIKVDVEGAELLVLRGAERVLRRCHPLLLFECTLSGLQLFDIRPEAVYGYLHGLQYSIFLVRDWLLGRPPIELGQFISTMSHPAQAFNFVASCAASDSAVGAALGAREGLANP